MRIEALGLAGELERGLAKGVDAVGVFGQDAAAQIALLARGETGGEARDILVRKNLRQRQRHFMRAFHQRRAAHQRVRIEPQRIGGKLARQRQAVAIDDIPARGNHIRAHRLGGAVALEQAEVGDLQQRHRRNRAKEQHHLARARFGHGQRVAALAD